METWTLNNHTLEYDDNTHCYICDGVILKSVSAVLDYAFPKTYKDIDKSILKRAAELGTQLHKAIEDYENKVADDDFNFELHSYKVLKKENEFEVIASEIPVLICFHDVPVLAGRLDQVVKQVINGFEVLAINDIKRTSEVHLDRLKLQLSLYAIGLEQCYNDIVEQYGYVARVNCVHIKKQVREFINVLLDREYAMETLRSFVECNKKDEDDIEW